LIQHKHVKVNDRVVDIPSFIVREGNSIAIRDAFKSNVLLEDSIKLSKAIDSKPEWVEVDYENKAAKIVRIPKREDIRDTFNEQLVVELYSK
jgi:small subunit ribosomal protein S4